MIINIGYFALLASIVLSVYSIIAILSGIQRNNNNLLTSAKNSQCFVFILVFISFLSLCYAFVIDDFSVKFVAAHSSSDLPLLYKITAVWGGMEGSLLLWELILTFFIAIVVLSYRNSNREILPYTLIILSVISLFLLFLLIGWSNPLVRHFPAPFEGNGLNPLLQNPGMIFHPPSLYLGYVGFSIPFAFAIGSLLHGKLDNEWILTIRRWTLFSWLLLTAGIMLGAQWAYVELGWGGYWAWDPVENASLMPWLTGTAFLHSIIVQEKRNALKVWNIVLIIATFVLSILGTFITRSGILNSVHSFSKSNIGPAFLFFIAVVLIFSICLLLARKSLLTSKIQNNALFSKENSFLLNNIIFVVMSFTVLYGTVFPLLAEALANKKLSIQAPFFNTIMAPIAVIMVFLMGITHILGWKKTSISRLRRNSLVPTILTIIATALIIIFMDSSWQMVLLGASAVFAAILILREFFQSHWINRKQWNEESGWITLFFRDKRRKGGLLVHLGIILMTIGVCGAFFNEETSLTFSPGEIKSFGGYELVFKNVEREETKNHRNIGIKIDVLKNNQSLQTLFPVKSYYPTSPQPMTEVAIHRTIMEDLYISLASINKDGSATIDIYVNPMVNFIWISMIFFTIGILYAFTHTPVQLKKIRP